MKLNIVIRMGLIYRNLIIKGDKNKAPKEMKALFDTGAEDCAIKESEAKEVCTIRELEVAPEYELADGSKTKPIGVCDFYSNIKEDGHSCLFIDRMYVFKDEAFSKDYDISIGVRAMQVHRIKLDFNEDKLDLSECHKPRRRGTRRRIT